MLILISEGASINPDYIINLFLADHPLHKGDIVNEHRYSIVAKMIDGSSLQLMKTKDKEEAQTYYNRILSIASVSVITHSMTTNPEETGYPRRIV